MPDLPDIEHDGEVLTESETKLEKPKLYKVILHNDDFTTMDFVVFILVHVFLRSEIEAFAIMLKVHNEGIGIAGVYPYEVAETKAHQVVQFARENEMPLQASLRKSQEEG